MSRCSRLFVVLVLVTAAAFAAAAAQAHLPKPAKPVSKMSPARAAAYYDRVVSHCRFVKLAGKGVPKRSHAACFKWARVELEEARAAYYYTLPPVPAIRVAFGPYAGQAITVSWCESRHWPGASNGQYLGLFQMGSSERAIYGHSSTSYGQALAAWRYFVASGYDWSPWACKPW